MNRTAVGGERIRLPSSRPVIKPIKTHGEKQRPADGSVTPVRLPSIRRRPEHLGADDEYPPPLHQIPEVVGVARVLPQASLADPPTSVGLITKTYDSMR